MSKYLVKAGDSWMSIAGDAYGDQRQYGAIMAANSGVKMLHPGDVIDLPDDVAPNPVITNEQWANTPTGVDPKTGQYVYGNAGWQGYGSGGGTGTGTQTGTGHNKGGQGAGPAAPNYGPQTVPGAGEQGVMDYITAHQGEPQSYGVNLPLVMGARSQAVGGPPAQLPTNPQAGPGWNTFAPNSQYIPNPYGIPSRFGPPPPPTQTPSPEQDPYYLEYQRRMQEMYGTSGR